MPEQDLLPEAGGLEIAIVGMAGRFPGASDIEAFWQNIRDGVESVVRYTDEQLRERGVPAQLLADPAYVKAGVPFDGIDRFDAEFFGYTPREAEQIDPQHRLFLECAWQALEHAGHDTMRCAGTVGVYAGSGANLYLMRHLLPRHGLHDGGSIAELLGLMSGNLADALCTRVAYKLDLRGPAVTLQTACSTSLMAVHTACQALLGQECDVALAGGVSLNLLQRGGYRHQAGAIFSPDGHCRAFDARAGGTLLGSGVGIVVLKRLDDALRDGDTVHAVIKGSAANNDGANKVGFTAPSIDGQAAVIRAAQALAGVAADTIGYVEAHGTGTTLGDPIEIAALTQAFRASTARTGFCAVGSVKTNIGHLDAAAGVAGLIKTVMALKQRSLPPSLHFERPNPQIDFDGSPFRVNTVVRPWPAGPTPRRAGVSAFGIGGTNVHVVLEEAAAEPVAAAGAAWQVLPLSAPSATALRQMAQGLAGHLRQTRPQPCLGDLAQTLQMGRRAFGHRCAVVAGDVAQAVESLLAIEGPATRLTRVPAQGPGVVFLFPGGGVQHANMGLALYRSEPVFRAEVDRCCELLRAELGSDLRQLWFPPAGAEAAADQALARMDNAQPALFVAGYALARLWIARGVQPAAMLGHSLGEYVAACLAGVFQLEDALRIVAARGRLLHALPPGAMTAVPLPEGELEPLLRGGCDLAAVNGERLCVLSGPLAAIEAAEDALKARDITPRRLHVAVASHSAMTEPVLAELERVVAAVPRQAPRLPFVSSVTGQPITAEQATSPAYWARHLRRTVRFADGLHEVLRVPGRVLLEAGPGETLAGLARQHPLGPAAAGIWASQTHPLQQARNEQQMAQALAGLWCAGVELDWAACHPGRPRRRVPLPTYPFQRRSYWIEAAPGGEEHRPPEEANASSAGVFHVPAWQRSAPSVEEPGAAEFAVAAGACVLVFADAAGLADALGERLRDQGAAVVRVEAGEAFARSAPSHYRVRPAERSDHEALLRELESVAGPVVSIYHLWGVDAPAPSAGPAQEMMLAHGFHSVVALVQALESGDRAKRPRRSLMVVASHSEDITGLEPLCPEKATLFALCKVVGQESPQIDCRAVDVARPACAEAAARLAAQLLAEARHRGGDTPVALRGLHRWVKTYEAMRYGGPSAQRLRRKGVYLITGGLGGVGLALALHLAQHWQARLVLLGRTPLPERGRWASLAAADDPSGALRQTLRQLLACEAAGSEVLVLSADVLDAPQMHAAVASARRRFGALHGVVHAAGHAENGMMSGKTRESVERVLAPKLRGTQVLLEAVGDERLDFMLLCSSIASLAGGLGKSDYAAANAHLDATAAVATRERRYPVFAVNWDAWRDLGMAAGLQLPDGVGMDGPQAALAFEQIVNGPALAQVVISTTDLPTRLGEIDQGMLDILSSSGPLSASGRSHPRPTLQTAYVAPQGELQQALAALWTEMLGIAPVGVHDNLFELGGDSLLAIQLLGRVRKNFGAELHPATFFKAPTVHELAVLVETWLIEDIEAAASEPGEPIPASETV